MKMEESKDQTRLKFLRAESKRAGKKGRREKKKNTIIYLKIFLLNDGNKE